MQNYFLPMTVKSYTVAKAGIERGSPCVAGEIEVDQENIHFDPQEWY